MSRSIGFYAATSVAVVCAAGIVVIGVWAFTSEGPARGTGGFEGASNAFVNSDSVDVRDPGLSGAEGLRIQVMDKDDRTRLAAELRSDTIEPLQAQRYRVGEPQATLFLDNGRTVTIESRTGVLVMPDRANAPESGRLTEDVVIRVFDPDPNGERADTLVAAPSMVWEGSELTFDSTLGEASTDQPFVLSTAGLEFRAADARVLINQTLERLERFTVRQGGTIVQLAATDQESPPGPTDSTPAEPTQPESEVEVASNTGDGGAAEKPPVPEPLITFYQAALREGVTLTIGNQSIKSDRLDLFARTIDNRLPAGAIGRFDDDGTTGAVGQPVVETEVAAKAESDEQPSNTASIADASDGTNAVSDDTTEEAADSRFVLSWAGAMEISPLASRPPELEKDDVYARFTSAESGLVIAEDSATEAGLRTAVIEYGLTTHVLTASGPGQQSVEFSSADRGTARMGHFVLPLRTGIAPIAGPGEFIDPHGGRVDWNTRAELHFHVVDGRVVGELREAICVGGAEASNDGASIQAELLHAHFDTTVDGSSTLERLVASDRASIDDGRGSGGPADQFTIQFSRGENGEPVPTTFEAKGQANLRQPGAVVRADYLYAQLETNEDGDIDVSKAWADGDVRLERFEDGIEIDAEHLFADLNAELLEVESAREASESEPTLAKVRRGETVIEGEFVRLNGAVGEAEVRGAGTFEHRAGRSPGDAHVFARWTEGMSYDDLAGTLACVGGVYAVHEPDRLSRDIIDAEVLRVDLAPASESAEASDETERETPFESEFGGDREVLRVYAAGGELLGLGETLATVESVLFAPGSESDPVLERAFRLSGVEIISDNTAGTIDVPGRGRLFVADLRENAEASPGEDERGSALFDWTGSFHADRAGGHAEMHEGVQMSHNSLSDGAKTLLESGDLEVRFAPAEGDEPGVGGLRSAVATRDVYLKSNGRELSSHVLHYDPDAGIARALGDGTSRVRMLDDRGAPTTASAIVWDLKIDRVDVVDPGTIVIPRID